MKRKILLSVVLLSHIPTIALAADDAMTVGLGLTTSIMYDKLPSAGLEAEVNLNKYIGFTAGILSSKVKADKLIENTIEDADANLDVDVNKAEISRRLALAGVRFFPWAGSFNVLTTVATGAQQTKLDVTSSQTSEVIKEELNYKLTIASITIGNTWRWKHVYVGADWLGYSTYLGGSDERKSESTTTASSALGKGLADFVKLSDAFAQKGGPIFIAFRLGVGF